jgi:hypothetical protein
MRLLKNGIKVFGFNELSRKSKIKAIKYIAKRKLEGVYSRGIKKDFNFTENDFEWFKNGKIMFYTNNIDNY